MSLADAERKTRFAEVIEFLLPSTTLSQRQLDKHLSTATEHSWVSVVRALVARGARPSRSTLELAVTTKPRRRVEPDRPRDPLPPRPVTAIEKCVESGDVDAVKHVLENVAPAPVYGETLLHVAAWEGTIEMVKTLIAAGIDPNAHSISDDTLLRRSVLCNPSLTKWLLTQTDFEIDVNAVFTGSYQRTTVLHEAARVGDLDIVKLLVGKGANCAAPGHMGVTPVGQAFDSCNPEVAEYLLSVTPVSARDTKRKPLLHIPAGRDWVQGMESLKLLADEKFDIDVRDDRGYTTLHLASDYGRLRALKWLLKNGADPNTQTDFGETPLDLAASKGHVDVVKHLANDAKVAARESPLCKALVGGFHACQQLPVAIDEHLSVIRCLAAHSNMDVNDKDESGETLLHVAGRYKRKEVFDLLVELGADAGAKNEHGFTPVYILTTSDKEYMANLFASLGKRT